MQNRTAHQAVLFAGLFAFWLLLSGRFEPLYVGLGILSSGAVVLLTDHFLYTTVRPEGQPATSVYLTLLPWQRLLLYLPWLLARIIEANLNVAYLVLHPKLPIDPVVLRFRTPLHSDAAQVILATSITLTPGTVTVDLANGEFLVHALNEEAASGLVDGHMQRRVASVFRVAEEEPDVQVARRLHDHGSER